MSSQARSKLQEARRTDEQIREIESPGLTTSQESESVPKNPKESPAYAQTSSKSRALSEAPFYSPHLRDRKRHTTGQHVLEPTQDGEPLIRDDTNVVPLDVYRLPRGGVYVETSLGPVLVGSPSGTLKDILKEDLTVPKYLVSPSDSFSRTLGSHLGVNLAEFEMIVLYSHFFGNRKEPVTILCDSAAQSDAMRIALEESLIPSVFDKKVFINDFTAIKSNSKMDLSISEEHRCLRRQYYSVGAENIALGDLCIVKSLDEDGEDGMITSRRDGFTLQVSKGEGHGGEVRLKEVHESGQVRKLKVSAFVKLPDIPPMIGPRFEFTPPLFGVTVLGNSNSFDPDGPSTGYVIWVNHRGIFVNPPAYCATRMELEMGIHPDMIKCVILTSSHGDIGQGAFQKILQEERIVTHTTKTIHDGFIRKYAALSGLRPKTLKSASRFRQIKIGTPMKICAASFEFFYNFDTAPTLGFTVSFGGQALLFSGGYSFCIDTMGALSTGISISPARRDFMQGLLHRNFDRVFYDAPLGDESSVISLLESLGRSLDKTFKEKLLVNHVSLSDLPGGLNRGPDGFGSKNTIVFDVATPKYSVARNLIESVEDVMFFRGLSIEHAASFVQIAEVKSFKAGETVMKASSPILFFSIVLSGCVNVTYKYDDASESSAACGDPVGTEGNQTLEIMDHQWVTGDCFGEEAIINGVSTVGVVTATDVDLLQIAIVDLQWILAGTGVRERIQHCHDMRVLGVLMERVLNSNTLLESLTRGQKLALEMNANIERVAAGYVIWNKGDSADFAVLIIKGRVVFPNAVAKLMSGLIKKSGTMMVKREDARHNYCPDVFERGAWIGNASDLVEDGGLRGDTLKATSACEFYKINSDAIKDVLSTNPGLYVALGASEFVL